MASASAASSVLPLLVWNEQLEIDRLQLQRLELLRRIKPLRPHCHRRVELLARLRELTARQLQLQAALGRLS